MRRTASCACGQLRVECDGDPVGVSLCHCTECQKRTGSAFGIACLFTIGRVHLSVELDTDPLRVTVGESSAARVRVTNLARTPALPIGLEFPVGDALGRFTLPGLGGDLCEHCGLRHAAP